VQWACRRRHRFRHSGRALRPSAPSSGDSGCGKNHAWRRPPSLGGAGRNPMRRIQRRGNVWLDGRSTRLLRCPEAERRALSPLALPSSFVPANSDDCARRNPCLFIAPTGETRFREVLCQARRLWWRSARGCAPAGPSFVQRRYRPLDPSAGSWTIHKNQISFGPASASPRRHPHRPYAMAALHLKPRLHQSPTESL